jgi:hypothetical protein
MFQLGLLERTWLFAKFNLAGQNENLETADRATGVAVCAILFFFDHENASVLHNRAASTLPAPMAQHL